MKEVSKLAQPRAGGGVLPSLLPSQPDVVLVRRAGMRQWRATPDELLDRNTGDIRIQGLEGPYTMVLIDGMPIVSGLGTVYGLNGIPSALIERMEVVKGAASTLYGSEAVGD